MGHGKETVRVITRVGYKSRTMIRLASKLPVAKSVICKVLGESSLGISSIPVNKDLEIPGDIPVPFLLLEHFIDISPRHVITNSCMCRRENGCTDYDPEIGCLFLGEGARQIEDTVGRHVQKEEALDYAKRAVDSGLIPNIGKVRFDAIVLGVKEHNRLMTVCFCCPCCCIGREFAYIPRKARDGIVKLRGVTVEVTGDCSACGKCVDACPMNQIKIVNGRARIGEECKGCGRCVATCPFGSITIAMDDPSYFDEAVKRLSPLVSS
ncbi:MAG: 4Fe-4S binding protein [Actinobacteria bacterium]|nr:4Fe-4S binding protein [Actinomycetota bacterium]